MLINLLCIVLVYFCHLVQFLLHLGAFRVLIWRGKEWCHIIHKRTFLIETDKIKGLYLLQNCYKVVIFVIWPYFITKKATLKDNMEKKKLSSATSTYNSVSSLSKFPLLYTRDVQTS